MLQLLYIIAFAILAVLAIGNLIRSLFTLGVESQRSYRPRNDVETLVSRSGASPHPELLDESGKIIDEPLLVMRSMTVEDAREQLDAAYRNSPGSGEEG
ncbi:DUF2973 domain-containing protein [Altericista sp. CCNU0014]|uniref:DUF2973 domain-containing protein n=1 Tax=Altericista sp. CCNU0014 TaxID=3082949 RepID=UPI0038508FC0